MNGNERNGHTIKRRITKIELEKRTITLYKVNIPYKHPVYPSILLYGNYTT